MCRQMRGRELDHVTYCSCRVHMLCNWHRLEDVIQSGHMALQEEAP